MAISNYTNITVQNLTDIANSSNVNEFLINIDRVAFGAPVFWFVILLLIWIISFFAAQQMKDQVLNNAMYSGAFCSILAIIARTITSENQSLITDSQMMIFPIVTIILAVIIWSIKD